MFLMNLVLAGLLFCSPFSAEGWPEEPVQVQQDAVFPEDQDRIQPSSRGGVREPVLAPLDSTAGASFLPVPEPELVPLGAFSITGYSNFDPSVDGRGIMATGYRTFPGAVATDPRVIPMYSVLRIEGLPGTYVALDQGGAVKGAKIDVFFAARAQALAMGRQVRQVYLVR